MFTANLVMTPAGVAKITLTGELDAASAPAFKEKIEEAANKKATRLVLLLADLTYIASAGIRVLIFANQKMKSKVDLYVIAAQEQVMSTLKKTGLDQSFIAADRYDPQLDGMQS